jgi:hypothetical protein
MNPPPLFDYLPESFTEVPGGAWDACELHFCRPGSFMKLSGRFAPARFLDTEGITV